MEDALRLEEQIKAEEEAAVENEAFLRARYVAWAQDKTSLALKKDLALVLCRGADPQDKQLAVCYLRECWEVSMPSVFAMTRHMIFSCHLGKYTFLDSLTASFHSSDP